MTRIVDLCAGPGGWDEAIPDEDVLGIELDPAACATREAAGHRTEQADVTALDPKNFGRVEGLIASPPCQTFSAAGDREGVTHLGALVRFIDSLQTGWREPVDPTWDRVKTGLVLEPLRWAHALTPEWIALEQVPPVLPIWEATARTLWAWGYTTWTGCLSAETFGVPQTRNRAILMAHRRKQVQPPPPTHQRYEPGVPAQEQHGLFGTLLPWVSMAEALGWGLPDRPCWTISGGGAETGGAEPIANAKNRARLAGVVVRTGANSATKGPGYRDDPEWRNRSKPYERPITDPAPTVDGTAGGAWVLRDIRENGAVRSADEPAPTICASHDNGNLQWTLHTNRGQAEDGTRQTRDSTAPAPALTAKAGGQWAWERPATTIVGSFRPDICAPPGWRGPGDGPRQNQPGAIKLTLRDGLILQSFRPDYPVQGSKTKQWEQVGNAIPPLMARAILGALVE